MRRLYVIVLIAIFAFLFTACAINDSATNKTINQDNIVELLTINNNNKIIYDRYYQKLVSYNLETHLVEKQSDSQNYFQYGFNTDSKYFSSGNSITNNFEILYVEGNTVKPIIRLDDGKNQSIFPLATDCKSILFIQIYYDDKGNEINRKLVSLINDSKLIEYSFVSGYISGGVILSNNLYYTIYNSKNNNYSLYELNLSDYSNIPKLIEDNVPQSELYVHNNKIYISDKNKIYNDDDYFNKAVLNNFYDEFNVLIQININKEGKEVLSVINTNNKNTIFYKENVIDYSIQNGILTIYCENEIENIALDGIDNSN